MHYSNLTFEQQYNLNVVLGYRGKKIEGDSVVDIQGKAPRIKFKIYDKALENILLDPELISWYAKKTVEGAPATNEFEYVLDEIFSSYHKECIEYDKLTEHLDIVKKYKDAFNLTFDLAANKQIRKYPRRCFGVCDEYYPVSNESGPMAVFYNTIMVMLKEGSLTKEYIQALANQDYAIGKNMITNDYGDEYTKLNSQVLKLLAVTCKAIYDGRQGIANSEELFNFALETMKNVAKRWAKEVEKNPNTRQGEEYKNYVLEIIEYLPQGLRKYMDKDLENFCNDCYNLLPDGIKNIASVAKIGKEDLGFFDESVIVNFDVQKYNALLEEYKSKYPTCEKAEQVVLEMYLYLGTSDAMKVINGGYDHEVLDEFFVGLDPYQKIPYTSFKSDVLMGRDGEPHFVTNLEQFQNLVPYIEEIFARKQKLETDVKDAKERYKKLSLLRKLSARYHFNKYMKDRGYTDGKDHRSLEKIVDQFGELPPEIFDIISEMDLRDKPEKLYRDVPVRRSR